MKIGDQKVQRTVEKQKVRGLLQDKKVPGTYAGTTAADPGLLVQGLPQDSWERARVNGPLPCQTRPEQHCERPGCLKSQGGE